MRMEKFLNRQKLAGETYPLIRHFKADCPKTKPFKQNDPAYTSKCFIVLRHTLLNAQIQCAMAEIYQRFAPLATIEGLVSEGNDHYNASQEIKDFISWSNYSFELRFQKPDTPFKIKDYQCQEDGTFKNQADQVLRFRGAASNGVIGWFFADPDFMPHNCGIQIREQAGDIIFVKIDHAAHLECSVLEAEFKTEDVVNFPNISLDDSDFELPLPEAVVKSAAFQKEKQSILTRLAATPFAEIESILRKHITVDIEQDQKAFMQKMIAYHQQQLTTQTEAGAASTTANNSAKTDLPNLANSPTNSESSDEGNDPATTIKMLQQQIAQPMPAGASLDARIAKLRQRHQLLRQYVQQLYPDQMHTVAQAPAATFSSSASSASAQAGAAPVSNNKVETIQQP